MYELRDLERFMAIVAHRNFGRAARALGMTQPALSRRIAVLEREIGAPLFSRERRQIELTTLGELLVREARAILSQVSLAERTMRDAVRGATGHLRVGTRSIGRYRLIPEALRRLRASHPRVVVSVTEPMTGLPLDLIRQGTIDVTVVRGPIILGDDLRADRLRSDPVVAALPVGHRLAKLAVVDVADLAEERFVDVAVSQAFGYRDLARSVAVRAGFIPRVVQTFDTIDTLMLCVAAGIGIAFMHDASQELAVPGIVFRPLRPAGPPVDLQAVWRTADRNPVIDTFLGYLAAAARYEHGPNAPETESRQIADPPSG
jgi:DNA-binding transcriptional LysR family regulator